MDHFYYFCLVFVMLSRLFIAAFWSPVGKGLTFWLSFVMFNYVFFFTFRHGVLDQVWYLIVSIPDMCPFLTSTCVFVTFPHFVPVRCNK